MPVIELRQYTLHPGARDTLIDIFDAHFLEGQEQYGMTVLGQFRDLDDPDRFVWLRSFTDMEARQRALAGFYGGPVWLEHREAANATMIAFDDVLLLRPIYPGSGFKLHPATRPPKAMPVHLGPLRHAAGARDADPADHAGLGSTSIAIDIYPLHPDADVSAAGLADGLCVAIEQAGGELVTSLVTETSENTFPQLPLREGETVLIIVMRFAEAAALAAYRGGSGAAASLAPELARQLAGLPAMLRLAPTSRSLLR